jgi:hypothetical protein
MKSGKGKSKGSAFEREVCKDLSLWLSGGKRKDLFWRSAMSGGRATIHGVKVRQAGDITAVALEAQAFTQKYVIECKHYRNLRTLQFLLEGKGKLAKFWTTLQKIARQHGKSPILIARSNKQPTIVITPATSDLIKNLPAKSFVLTGSVCVTLLKNLLKSAPPK